MQLLDLALEMKPPGVEGAQTVPRCPYLSLSAEAARLRLGHRSPMPRGLPGEALLPHAAALPLLGSNNQRPCPACCPQENQARSRTGPTELPVAGAATDHFRVELKGMGQ